MYQSPSKAKRLHFDVIPKSVDEYIAFNKSYHEEQDFAKKIANPAFHMHHGNVPKINNFGISFSLLLNLASVCNPEDKSVLWGFITRYAPEATPEKAPYLDHMVGFAINYYNDFIKTTKVFLKPTDAQKTLLDQVSAMLSSLPPEATAEEIQNQMYTIGKIAGYENLRDFFQELYQILLGQTQGPRLGSFIKLFGIESTQNLIKQKLSA